MATKGEDIRKLLETVQSARSSMGVTAPTTRVSSIAPTPGEAPYKSPAVPTGPGDPAIGAVNIFGGFMRGITSLGRGIVNYAGNVLPYANQVYDNLEDGIQPDDLPKVFDAAANIVWSGLGGFAKGFAYSFMPPTQESRNQLSSIFGGDVYEGAYELFKSKDFEAAAQNLPFLAEATKEEGVGFGIPDEWIGFDVPFLGIEKGKGLEFTKAGLYSFGFDVLTDPISFLPIGLGGAAKGLKSGVQLAAAAKRAKPGTPVEAFAPKPLYRELRVGPDKNQLDAAVAYNAMDTSPLTFIGKEMARGYKSAFQAVRARSVSRRVARVDRQNSSNIMKSALLKIVDGGVAPENVTAKMLYDEALTIANQSRRTLTERMKDRKIRKEAQAEIDKIVQARLAGIKETSLTPEAAEVMAQQAARYAEELANVPQGEKGARVRALLARDAAREIRRRIPVVRKEPGRPIRAEQVNQLGDNFVKAQDVEAGQIGSFWDNFRNADEKLVPKTTKDAAIREMFAPLKTGRDGGLTTKEVRDLSGLVVGELTRRAPRATKGKGVKGEEMARPTELADIIDEARGGLEAELKKPWDKITAADVSGEVLERVLKGQFRVFGERLRQFSLRETQRVSKDFRNLQSARDGGYNPLTVQPEPAFFKGFSPSQAGYGGRTDIVRKLSTAGDDYYPTEIISVLKAAGVKNVHNLTYTELKAKALEALEALTFLSARVGSKAVTAKAFNTRLGQLSLADSIRLSDDNVAKELARIEATAEKTYPGFGQMSKKDINKLATDLDNALAENVNAYRSLPPEVINSGLEALGSSANKIRGIRETLQTTGPEGLPVDNSAEFIAEAYRVSRLDNSIDGGRFADYVDEVVLRGAEMPKTGGEIETLLFDRAAKWDGQGLTIGLLTDMMRNVTKGAAKPIGTKNRGFNTFVNEVLERERAAALRNIEENVDFRIGDDIIDENASLLIKDDAQWREVVTALASMNADTLRKLRIAPPVAAKLSREELIVANQNAQKRVAALLKAPASERRIKYSWAQELKLQNKAKGGGVLKAVEGVNARAKALGKKGVTRQRAEELLEQVWPERLTKEGVKAVTRTTPERARAAVLAEALMARFSLNADLASRQMKLDQLDKTRFRTAEGLAKEKAAFDATLKRIDAALAKQGFKRPAKNVEALDLGEIRDTKNPRVLVKKLETMRTVTDDDITEWRNAVDDLLKWTYEKDAKTPPFKTGEAVIRGYLEGLPDITPEQVRDVLAAYNYGPAVAAAREGRIPETRLLKTWITRSADHVTQAEKELVEMYNPIGGAGFHPVDADETMQSLAMLSKQDQAEYVRTYVAQYEDLISMAHARGYGWLVDEAIMSLGPAFRNFFTKRAQSTKSIHDDMFGTTTRIIEQEGKEIGIKESYEILSQYTGFGQLIARIKDYVAKSDLADPEAAIQDLTVHAMRIQETYMLLRGVVPSATPSKRVGAEELYALFKNKELADQVAGMNYIPAFIFQGDILEILPRALAKDIWFSGPINSLPPSAVGEAARVLISHMSNLKPGEWFTKEQYQAVYYHMYSNVVAQARNTKPTKGSQNWLEMNGEAGIDKIDRYIRYLLSDAPTGNVEAPSFRLFEKHRDNMLYSSIVLKEKAPSGKIIGELREKMERLLMNGLATKEMKFAAIQEHTDDLNKYLKIDDLNSDFADYLVAHDAMVSLSASLTRDDLIDVAESLAIQKVAQRRTKLKAAKAKPADITKAKKAFHAEKKKQYMETQNARADLLLDMYMQKGAGMQAAQREFGQSAAYDVFNDMATEGGNMAWYLRFFDGVGKKLSYNWGMETLRPAVGGAQRFSLRMENMFTKGSARVARKWERQQELDGVEYMTSSFESLKRVPDESIPQLLDDLDILAKGFGPAGKQNGISEKLAGEVSEALERIRAITDADGARIFDNFDDLKMNALMDIARPLFRVFDELGDKMPDPQLLNFYLRQAGELTPAERQAEIPLGDAIDEASAIKNRQELKAQPLEQRGIVLPPNMAPENLRTAWRDMDWSGHLKSLNSMHFALRKAEEWYMIAGEATRLSGAKKVTDFASPEAARQAGYIKIKGVEELKMGNELTGRELLYFMDTDNYYYPAVMVNEIKNLADFLGAPYRKGLGAITQAKFFRRINTVQNFAKQMMTNMRPGNHLMNFMGGVLINDVAGLRNPANYLYSLRLLKAAGISEKELGVSRSAAEYWMERHFTDMKRTSGLQIKEVSDPTMRKDAVGLSLGDGISYVSYEDLASLVMKEGGFVPWQQSANLDVLNAAAAGPNLQSFKKTGLTKKAWNETSEVVGSWASHRDDFVRMALLIDNMKKNSWDSLEDAVKSSLDVVNRYHPQPQEVSKFNRDVTRHLILFFTWRAKTLGTIVGDLLERPGRLLTWERAYYNYQAGQGYQPEYFGSHDPKDEPVRSWQQSTMGILTGGNEYSMSIAHPMWDLMGSDGWLSQIKWDSNQSAAANVTGAFLGTSQQVIYASAPLIENLFVNWLNGRTANGQDLMRGGITDEEMPTFLQEVANGFGLNVVHATLAYFYPEQINKANWDRLTPDERSQELLRSWFNWATGARAQKYLTPDNVKKAGSELKTTLRGLAQRGGPTMQPGGEDAISSLLDYLNKASGGSLSD